MTILMCCNIHHCMLSYNDTQSVVMVISIHTVLYFKLYFYEIASYVANTRLQFVFPCYDSQENPKKKDS